MSKYGYEELQLLYEDGFRGDAMNSNPNYDYGGKTARGLSAEWPALRGIKSEPLGTPTGDFYSGEDEEVTIPKHHLKKKINELIKDANDRGLGHSIDHLHNLLTFADSYKK